MKFGWWDSHQDISVHVYGKFFSFLMAGTYLFVARRQTNILFFAFINTDIIYYEIYLSLTLPGWNMSNHQTTWPRDFLVLKSATYINITRDSFLYVMIHSFLRMMIQWNGKSSKNKSFWRKLLTSWAKKTNEEAECFLYDAWFADFKIRTQEVCLPKAIMNASDCIETAYSDV